MTYFEKTLTVHKTTIPGLLIIDLPVHGDSRGWFKENWQREKMQNEGLPDFVPVQNNISFNDEVGVTRGIHAEPWDKFVSVASGEVFAAWVDLREGKSFGRVFTTTIDASKAVYIPRGVANSYQTLVADTSYVYLVNDHWSPTAEYTFVNLADETVGIEWPIPLENALLSDKDKSHPRLADVTPIKPKNILVVGASGQLGTALRKQFPQAVFTNRDEIDISDSECLEKVDWKSYNCVINAAAFTAVDAAETQEGRVEAWSTNVAAVSQLAKLCDANAVTLVHISSDYVFDGTKKAAYLETDSLSPLGVYGQTKAAADAVISSMKGYYILRTSWVIGEGNNFVRTMSSLAQKGINPEVVNDQIGRLTFAEDLALAINHLLQTKAPFGIYNLTNSGEPTSWVDVAKQVFELIGHDPDRVKGVSTAEYYAGKSAIAPRPLNSVLSMKKIEATGFVPPSWMGRLKAYLEVQ